MADWDNLRWGRAIAKGKTHGIRPHPRRGEESVALCGISVRKVEKAPWDFLSVDACGRCRTARTKAMSEKASL
jgi:hypothetical protein